MPCVALLLASIAALAPAIAEQHSSEKSPVSRLTDGVEEASQAGRYNDGVELAEEACRIARKTLGERHPDTMKCLDSLAGLYVELRQFKDAEPLYLKTLRLRRQTLDGEHPDIRDGMNNLAWVYRKQGRYQDAERLYRDVLRSRRGTPSEDHYVDRLASLDDLARLYADQGRHEDAKALIKTMRKLVLSHRESHGDDHPDTLKSMHDLAVLLFDQKRLWNADLLLSQTLQLRRKYLGNDHPDTLKSMHELARLYHTQGRYDEAEPLHWEALRRRREALGNEHAESLDSLEQLAALYERLGRHLDAEALYAKSLRLRRKSLGDAHPDVLNTMASLGYLYANQERYEEAETLLRDLLQLRRRHLGNTHPNTFSSLNDLTWLYNKQHRDSDAEMLMAEIRRLIMLRRNALGNEDPDTLRTMNDLARRLKGLGLYEEAQTLLLETLRLRQEWLGKSHPATLESMHDLAWLHIDHQGRYEDAEAVMQQTMQRRLTSLGNQHPDTLRSIADLAWLRLKQHQYEPAEVLYKRALRECRIAFGDKHPDTLINLADLAWLHIQQDRFWSAITLLDEVLQHNRQTLGKDHPDTLGTMNALGYVYLKQSRFSDAEEILVEAIFLQVTRIEDERQYTNQNMKYLSRLFMSYGRMPGNNHVVMLFFSTIAPVVLFLLLLSRSVFLKRPGRIVWISSVAFVPMDFAFSPISGWASSFFHAIDNAWIASLRAFLQVAVIEELSKLIVIIGVCWSCSLRQQPLAVIACGLAVGLSFAALENWDYAYASGLYSPIARLVLPLPGHVVDAGCAAGFLALAWRYPDARWRFRFLAVLVPILLHGSYDYLFLVDERVAADLDLVATLVAAFVVALGAAILTFLAAWLKRADTSPMAAIRSSSTTCIIAASYLSFGFFGIVIAAITLGDMSIALYATMKTLHDTVGMARIDEFPVGYILTTLLNWSLDFAELIIKEKGGIVVPLSGIELALIPTIAIAVIITSVILCRAAWRRLVEGVLPLADRPAET